MATTAGSRDRWLWIFLRWGLVALAVMRDGRQERRRDPCGFSDRDKRSDQILSNYSRKYRTLDDFLLVGFDGPTQSQNDLPKFGQTVLNIT